MEEIKNKIDFFEKNLKKIVKKDLKLKNENIEINVKVTGAEAIPFFIDSENQLLVIDEYFQNIKTFWDTTNVQILVQKIENKFEVEDIQNYKFYFFEKDENKIIVTTRNIDSTKISKYELKD
ncbi:hypothetical protein [Arcobacter sp. L]|uniref:hypothetical protein n=1 Tax=Arcobacter sp. L TaxID=944547 RepID=UPI000229657B|nr:hypothetical protein [Arcobacter sp. L]BAK73235.1 hypothetical protein ABLL_1360 [Arcobacter sp. L]